MIRIENISKSFDRLEVLKRISLQIPRGQATGIVGPNGSGKTTLIKMILGLVKPDEGTIQVADKELNGHFEYRHLIGYMPQIARYPENMKVRELIDFIKEVRNDEAVFEQELIEEFELTRELNKPLRNLSGGYRQKVGACIAMMFDPLILILDEPTAGLDPQSSQRFKRRLEHEKDKGKTILLTSHIMSEIEELTDHLVFLLEGKIRYDGSMNDLMQDTREPHLEAAVARMMEENL